MAYLIDSNIFIDAKNRYYHPQVCPGFWDWLVQANKQGKVFSIREVKDELTGDSEDELAQWAAELGDDFFLPVDEDDLVSLGEVAAWVDQNQQYRDAAKSTFLASADYYLVAQALAREYTVVTHELPSNQQTKIKIPNACVAHGVAYTTPWHMLRKQGACFVLGDR